jgi:hypothetical protein
MITFQTFLRNNASPVTPSNKGLGESDNASSVTPPNKGSRESGIALPFTLISVLVLFLSSLYFCTAGCLSSVISFFTTLFGPVAGAAKALSTEVERAFKYRKNPVNYLHRKFVVPWLHFCYQWVKLHKATVAIISICLYWIFKLFF